MLFDNDRWFGEIYDLGENLEFAVNFMNEENIKRIFENDLGSLSRDEIRKRAVEYHEEWNDKVKEDDPLAPLAGMELLQKFKKTHEGRIKILAARAFRILEQAEASILAQKRHTFILLGTYFDLILEDFLTALFYNYPDKMSCHVGRLNEKGKKDGRIHLSILLNDNSREAMFAEIAKEAINDISRKSYEKKIREIDSLTRQSGKRIDGNLKEKVIEVLNIRNSIVHENIFPGFSGYSGGLSYHHNLFLKDKDTTLQAIGVLEDLVIELGDICLRMKIPQNYYDNEELPPSVAHEYMLQMENGEEF
jgi:hypothetical protein